MLSSAYSSFASEEVAGAPGGGGQGGRIGWPVGCGQGYCCRVGGWGLCMYVCISGHWWWLVGGKIRDLVRLLTGVTMPVLFCSLRKTPPPTVNWSLTFEPSLTKLQPTKVKRSDWPINRHCGLRAACTWLKSIVFLMSFPYWIYFQIIYHHINHF